MMEQNLQNDPVKSPVIQEMILSNRIGCISAELAKRLNIAPEEHWNYFMKVKPAQTYIIKALVYICMAIFI